MAVINTPPINGAIVQKSLYPVNAFSNWLMQAFRLLIDVQNSGPTASRPTENLYQGKQYFDLTLGYPVWWVGPLVTDWVDATGAPA